MRTFTTQAHRSALRTIGITLISASAYSFMGLTTTCAQTWSSQISGTSALLSDIDMINDQEGWVVGWQGTILHTTNGGSTWSPQVSSTGEPLRGIDMINADEGWIVGGNGTVLHTINGGANWDPQTSGSIVEFRSVQFLNAMTGFACGVSVENNGYIVKTTTGGASWYIVAGPVGEEFNHIEMFDAPHGRAVGLASTTVDGGVVHQPGQILSTSDGGENWSIETSEAPHWVQGCQQIDAQHALACGSEGTLLRKDNGDDVWSTVTVPTTQDLYSMNFRSPDDGTIIGGSGVVLRSFDGGDNWSTESSSTGQFLYHLAQLNTGEAWAVGLGGTIIHRAVEVTTGVHDQSGDDISYLFPNPATDVITIRSLSHHTGTVQVIDAEGRVVQSASTTGEVQLDLTGLKPGSYEVMMVNPGEAPVHKRFVKL